MLHNYEREMSRRILDSLDEKVNRSAKDSVFVDLFAEPAYLLQLYQVLHPEDMLTQEEDLTVITLESLFLKERYNDLGFLAGNRLMILVEAQSTWSVNILIRFLLYAADTYSRYIENNQLNLYTSRKADLPVPELYLIYTGDRKNCPEEISLTREIFGRESADCAIEIRAKVLLDSRRGDILNQYVTFTKVFDEQVKKLGRTRAAVLETLRICREQDVLAGYLAKEEVAAIMYSYMDKEKILARYIKEECEAAHIKGHEKGLREGRKEGREEGLIISIRNLMGAMKISSEKAMELLNIPLSEQDKYRSRL